MRAQRARRSRFDSLAEEPEDDSNGYDDYAPSEESEVGVQARHIVAASVDAHCSDHLLRRTSDRQLDVLTLLLPSPLQVHRLTILPGRRQRTQTGKPLKSPVHRTGTMSSRFRTT